MKRVKEYVEDLFKGYNTEETDILKEEMQQHIEMEVENIMKSGASQNEAIDLAIKNFGDKKTISQELSTIFTKQKSFINIIKACTVTAFVLSIMLFIGSYFLGNKIINLTDELNNTPETMEWVKHQINSIIDNDDTVNREEYEKLDKLFNGYNDKYGERILAAGISDKQNNQVYYYNIPNYNNKSIAGASGYAILDSKGKSRYEVFIEYTSEYRDLREEVYNKNKEIIDNKYPLGDLTNILIFTVTMAVAFLSVLIIMKVLYSRINNKWLILILSILWGSTLLLVNLT